jgi:transcriptional regulator GlxA family with amidase domain
MAADSPLAPAAARDAVDDPASAGRSWTTRLTPHASRNRDLVRRVEELVVASLPKRLPDSVLVKRMGASIGELRRAFLDVRGATMYQALYTLRLELVRQILEQDPTRSPEAVAFECGFGHYGVFHRRYRRFLAERAPPSPSRDVPDAAVADDDSAPPAAP